MTHQPEKRPKKPGAWDIRNFVLAKVGPVIKEYSEWYSDFGVSLPDAFQFDPTGWTLTMWKINRAFELAEAREDSRGPWADAMQVANDEEREQLLADLRDEMDSGFRLFGKHLLDLYDKYGPDQAR